MVEKKRKTRSARTSVDPATQYAQDVNDGKILAGPDIRYSCARHLKDLKEAEQRGLVWDVEAVKRVIDFFAKILKLNGGEHEGQPFILLPWQCFVVGSIFGWKMEDGTRRFRMVYVESGKGSGKSPLAGGVGLYCLVADNEPRAEIYAAATKKDQAMILFRDAVAMVDQSPALSQRITKSGGAGKEWNLAFLKAGSFFRPISSDDGQSGPRPHCALIDEIHEHKHNTAVEMMRAGTKGRRQALIFMITNSGHDKTSVCYQSALEYANALDDIAVRTKSMSLVQASDEAKNVQKTVDAQKKQIEGIVNAVNYYKTSTAKYVADSLNFDFSEEQRTNFLRLAIEETKKLQVEEARLLETQQGKQHAINVLNGLNDQASSIANRKVALMAQELAQESEFNRLISLGNNLLSSRQILTNTPMSFGPLRVLPPTLDEKQTNFLDSAAREAKIAGMSQRDQLKQRSQWEAESMFPNDERYGSYKKQYVDDKLKAHDDREKMNNSLKSGISLTKEADRVTERYKDKMADLSVATEVQRVRALQGEKAAALYAAGHETGAKWTDEQRKAIQSSSVQLAEWTQKADEAVRKQREMTDALKDLKDATRKYNDDAALARSTVGMGDRRRGQEEERQQVERVFSKTDGGLEALKARQDALDALNNKYKEAAIAETDWRAGVSAGLENWVNDASNYAGQAASATQSAMTGMVDNVANALNGNKADWKSWSVDVLKSVQKVLLNMALVQSMKAAGGYFGGGFGSFMSSIIPNAKGGVYDSPSLSSYSGQIVSSPTMFAFAKGAGLMGEAGPEAIMPLTRGSDGSLGVRVLGLENLQSSNGDSKTQVTTSGGALISIDVGDINIISECGGQQTNAADLSGAQAQLRNTILTTVSSEMGRQGTPLYRLVKEIK